jgi:prevent-host-death family protein
MARVTITLTGLPDAEEAARNMDISRKPVSVAELKAKLSQYLAAVEAGQEIVVTRNGTPVARLGPLAGAAEMEGRIEELVRSGLMRPPRTSLDLEAFLSAERPRDPAGRSLDAVLEERAEGW